MIQRIQTVYLIVAFVLLALMFALPIAHLSSGEANYVAKAFGANNEMQVGLERFFWSSILVAVASLVSISTVFMYKKRKLQMRMCVWNFAITAAAGGGLFYEITATATTFALITNMGFAAVLLPIAFIFLYLAYKGVQRDEKLVRSIDRIR